MSTIAQTIMQQLGGSRFRAMTGAREVVALERGVRFRIGRNATRTNMVRITLRGDDTYDMEFLYVRNAPNPYATLARYLGRGMDPIEAERKIRQQQAAAERPTVVHEYRGVYCDQLETLFRDFTKLNTRLF